ncbi:hypothetical protein DPMN_075389 [Dreissena polymorpha]|uniref:Uncharacterized protein n=1 Tax=Dreissena polymorpha TaxID=45954 RepID=A0A9D4BMG8_DREPO|nr:hypothetical protein DPMN_075389 [Dreissena polymorpha]
MIVKDCGKSLVVWRTYSLFGSQWSEQLACAVEQSRWHSERLFVGSDERSLGASRTSVPKK